MNPLHPFRLMFKNGSFMVLNAMKRKNQKISQNNQAYPGRHGAVKHREDCIIDPDVFLVSKLKRFSSWQPRSSHSSTHTFHDVWCSTMTCAVDCITWCRLRLNILICSASWAAQFLSSFRPTPYGLAAFTGQSLSTFSSSSCSSFRLEFFSPSFCSTFYLL